jgi:hypothetical protein
MGSVGAHPSAFFAAACFAAAAAFFAAAFCAFFAAAAAFFAAAAAFFAAAPAFFAAAAAGAMQNERSQGLRAICLIREITEMNIADYIEPNMSAAQPY